MTGNTVLLGIAVAQLDGDAATRSSLARAGLIAGAAPGAWITGSAGRATQVRT